MKVTIIFLLILFLAYGVSSNKLFAQNPGIDQDTLLQGEKIDVVTVTVLRSPQNLFNIPAPVHVIGTQQLETGYSFTPVEALNQVPGVLMHHGTLNTNRLTIRGIGTRTPYGTNKIKAYFGEIPLSSGDGETTLEDMENSVIKRTEIIKGPSSSLYGAGLAGVLIFHPKIFGINFVQNQTTVASFGGVKNTLSAGIKSGKLQSFVSGTALKSEGYRENNNTRRNNFLWNSLYRISEQTTLEVLVNATKMRAYIPSSLDYPTYKESPESAAANWAAIEGNEEYSTGQLGVSLSAYTPNEDKFALAVFGTLKKLDELRPFNRLDESLSYLGWRTYWQKLIRTKKSETVLTTGFEMFREDYDWATFTNNTNQLLSDNKEKRQYENLYFQLESAIRKKWFISMGLNLNLTRFYYTDYFYDNGDQSGEHKYDPELSPRLGINYMASDKLSVFVNASHGFSTPTFEETLYPDGGLNSEIKPETGWSYEAGFRFRPGHKLMFAGSYYRIYVDNLLVAHRTGEDAYVGVNAGETLHAGFETELRWDIQSSSEKDVLSLFGNATFADYRFLDYVDEETDYSGNQLPGTAKMLAMVGALWPISKNFQLSAWYRYTGEMPLNDENSGYSDGFGTTNAELKYNGRRGKLKLEFKAGIQNVFDQHYASMLAVNAPSFGGKPARYYYPGNPRNYYVSLLIGLINNR